MYREKNQAQEGTFWSLNLQLIMILVIKIGLNMLFSTIIFGFIHYMYLILRMICFANLRLTRNLPDEIV